MHARAACSPACDSMVSRCTPLPVSRTSQLSLPTARRPFCALGAAAAAAAAAVAAAARPPCPSVRGLFSDACDVAKLSLFHVSNQGAVYRHVPVALSGPGLVRSDRSRIRYTHGGHDRSGDIGSVNTKRARETGMEVSSHRQFLKQPSALRIG